MPRFAANLTMMFTGWPFLDRFSAAADAGFDAVEFLFPYDHAPDELSRRIDQHGLGLALFNCPPGDWGRGDRGVACLPERREELLAGFVLARRYAEALGAQRLHLMAGLAPSGDPRAREAYRTALDEACAFFGPLGIDVLIEPINGRDMPGYHLDDFTLAADLIRELNLSNLKLQFDVYHRQILHGDVVRGLQSLLPLITQVQIASVPERCEPGTGEPADARTFEELDRLGYEGFFGCEYRPRGTTVEGLGWRDRMSGRPATAIGP